MCLVRETPAARTLPVFCRRPVDFLGSGLGLPPLWAPAERPGQVDWALLPLPVARLPGGMQVWRRKSTFKQVDMPPCLSSLMPRRREKGVL